MILFKNTIKIFWHKFKWVTNYDLDFETIHPVCKSLKKIMNMYLVCYKIYLTAITLTGPLIIFNFPPTTSHLFLSIIYLKNYQINNKKNTEVCCQISRSHTAKSANWANFLVRGGFRIKMLTFCVMNICFEQKNTLTIKKNGDMILAIFLEHKGLGSERIFTR